MSLGLPGSLSASSSVSQAASARARDPARGIGTAPPNFGRFPISHIQTFSGLTSSLAKVYRPSDEALRHSVENAHMMLHDPSIWGPLSARMQMVALLNWSRSR